MEIKIRSPSICKDALHKSRSLFLCNYINESYINQLFLDITSVFFNAEGAIFGIMTIEPSGFLHSK